MTSKNRSNRVVLLGRSTVPYIDVLRSALHSDWHINTWLPGAPTEALAEALARANAVVIGADAHTHAKFSLAPYGLQHLPHLRLVQLAFSSHDGLTRATLPRAAYVCNIQEHAITIAEYIVAAVLEWEIGLRHMDAALRRGDWQHSGALFGRPHGEIYGKTIGFIGCGSIAIAAANRIAAFGVTCRAVARSARPAVAPFEWVGALERLEELLQTSDYVVVACDLNDGTRGLLNRARLASMKRTAFVVSVTRAQVFEEAALFDALATKTIAGAALDVWFRYPGSLADAPHAPRPSTFPFHELDNLIMTPHASSWSIEHHHRRWRSVARNLDLIAAGQAPQQIVLQP